MSQDPSVVATEQDPPLIRLKKCARSGSTFTPTGNSQKYCGKCPQNAGKLARDPHPHDLGAV